MILFKNANVILENEVKKLSVLVDGNKILKTNEEINAFLESEGVAEQMPFAVV